jgi:hypothetical protein
MTPIPEEIKNFVDHVLEGSNDIHVVVGPLVWRPTDGTSSRYWYFHVSTSEADGGWRCDAVQLPDRDEAFRIAVIAELMRRPPLIVHLMEDELDAACLCEAIWPGKRITDVREGIERERREWKERRERGGAP